MVVGEFNKWDKGATPILHGMILLMKLIRQPVKDGTWILPLPRKETWVRQVSWASCSLLQPIFLLMIYVLLKGSKAFVQTSTGAIEVIEQINPGTTKSGVISW